MARGHNSALLGPGHPKYAALAGADGTLGVSLAQTYLSTCSSCKVDGVLCEEHRTTIIEVHGGGAQTPGYWQPAGPEDKTMVMPAITG